MRRGGVEGGERVRRIGVEGASILRGGGSGCGLPFFGFLFCMFVFGVVESVMKLGMEVWVRWEEESSCSGSWTWWNC